MATKQPFRKWGNWKSIGSYSYTQVLSYWSFEFIFKAKLKEESGNQKIQYGCQAAILKLTPLKINRLLPIYISTVPLKFGVDIQSQTKVRVWKPKHTIWPPGGLELIFKAKLKLESGNQEIQYGCQAAILKVTSLKIKRLLFMTKQTWLMLRKPCRLQTDGRRDGRTRWIQYTPPSNFVGRGIMIMWIIHTKPKSYRHFTW